MDRLLPLVAVCVGTRPEVIKMKPVIRALEDQPGLRTHTLLSDQHPALVARTVGVDAGKRAGMRPRAAGVSLPSAARRFIRFFESSFQRLSPDYVVVQGDTLTTFAAGVAAYFSGIRFAHVEAGLRTGDPAAPFPEEGIRRMLSMVADLHLAPTPAARTNLLTEGVCPSSVLVTGQSGIDSLLEALGALRGAAPRPGRPLALVTLHRRENWPVLDALGVMLGRVAAEHPRWDFVLPLHPNPHVQRALRRADHPANLCAVDPLPHEEMVRVLACASLVVTDSGGLQEEAASLGKPTILVRERSERPEGVAAGMVHVAGTDAEKIHPLLAAHLRTAPCVQSRWSPIYGDGAASARIAQAIAWRLHRAERPEEWKPAESRALAGVA